MADISPSKKNKTLTNLEMEAVALVNEEILGPDVTNEEKYEQLLEARKMRKPVSLIPDSLYVHAGGRAIWLSGKTSWRQDENGSWGTSAEHF